MTSIEVAAARMAEVTSLYVRGKKIPPEAVSDVMSSMKTIEASLAEAEQSIANLRTTRERLASLYHMISN